MHDEEGVYSTKRTPRTWRLPVPITSFQNCEERLDERERSVMVMVRVEDQQGQSGEGGGLTRTERERLKAREN